MSERYRVPKRRIRVSVSVCGKDEAVTLFLCDNAESHEGPELPSDLLNGTATFLAVENECGQIDVVNRDAIAVAVVAPDVEYAHPDDSATGAFDDPRTTLLLTVTLDDGRRIEGFASYQLPESARRLQDFLNSSEPFILLRRKDATLLINKQRIARVQEQESGGQSG